MAEVKVLSAAILTTIDKVADSDHGAFAKALTDWQPIAVAVCAGGKKAVKELVEQSRIRYVLRRCIKAKFAVELNEKGQVALTAKAVEAISKVDADKFAELKNRARNAHDKGLSDALANQGLETWKEAAKPKAKGNAEGATDGADKGNESPLAIPPGIVQDATVLRDSVLHFQQHAKLTDPGDIEAIGKLLDKANALIDKMNAKPEGETK